MGTTLRLLCCCVRSAEQRNKRHINVGSVATTLCKFVHAEKKKVMPVALEMPQIWCRNLQPCFSGTGRLRMIRSRAASACWRSSSLCVALNTCEKTSIFSSHCAPRALSMARTCQLKTTRSSIICKQGIYIPDASRCGGFEPIEFRWILRED